MTQGFETIKNKIDRFDYLRGNNFCMVNPLHKQNFKSVKKKNKIQGKTQLKLQAKGKIL